MFASRRALSSGGKSLLPSGIKDVHGDFLAGDAVSVWEGDTVFARGLCDYDAGAVRAIAGRRSSEIEAILGYKEMDEVIHRDDLSNAATLLAKFCAAVGPERDWTP